MTLVEGSGILNDDTPEMFYTRFSPHHRQSHRDYSCFYMRAEIEAKTNSSSLSNYMHF